MGGSHDAAKSHLRQALLSRRRGLDREWVARTSSGVCDRVIAWLAGSGCRRVVAYAAQRGEVDPAAAVAAALAGGATTYYPRLTAQGLEFRRAAPGELVPGALGIPEPPADGEVLPAGGRGAVVLVPGVGFDREGGRLGHGQGWYDRGLGAVPYAVRVGLCLEQFLVDHVPRDSWDVTMHGVATEQGLRWCARSHGDQAGELT